MSTTVYNLRTEKSADPSITLSVGDLEPGDVFEFGDGVGPYMVLNSASTTRYEPVHSAYTQGQVVPCLLLKNAWWMCWVPKELQVTRLYKTIEIKLEY